MAIRILMCLLCSVAMPTTVGAPLVDSAEVVNFRLSANEERTRVVFDLTGSVDHALFTLKSPERVVIDIENVSLRTALQVDTDRKALLRNIRNAPRNGNDLRIVLDLNESVTPKSFLLRPQGDSGYRLVIDLFKQNEASSSKPLVKAVPESDKLRDVVIAIDAGHGGKDPGASGHRGTLEKDIALAIARELARRVKTERGMRPVLIRDGDYYMGLRERIEKAREYKADLFISIHADAFHDKDARGSSVYALSLRGASSEAAEWLANRENASELIGGVSLNDKDDIVASVLLDLSQTATIQASLDVGSEVLNQLGQHNKLHRGHVQQAGFMVLKSPDIPSILVETAFISNPAEERKLTSTKHQTKIADAILQGVKRYFSRKPPRGTLFAHENNLRQESNRLSAVNL
ncbi:MAG TPA: N-acetylmuramoyl-L-alanine amidase [Gammaproteobacteria bacterium]